MKKTIIFDLEGTLVDIGGQACSQVFIAEDTLTSLTEDYDLAIVTGASRPQLEYVLSKTFLGKYFLSENTVTKDEVSNEKKTGKPFLYLIEKNQIQKAVILGDSEGDRLGSEALRVPFVQIDTLQMLNGENLMKRYVEEAVLKLDGSN